MFRHAQDAACLGLASEEKGITAVLIFEGTIHWVLLDTLRAGAQESRPA